MSKNSTTTEPVADLKLGLYRHYKGGEYEVIGLARHSETEGLMVVYRCLYKNGELWVRPLELFLGVASTGVPRFEYVDAPTEDSPTEDGLA